MKQNQPIQTPSEKEGMRGAPTGKKLSSAGSKREAAFWYGRTLKRMRRDILDITSRGRGKPYKMTKGATGWG